MPSTDTVLRGLDVPCEAIRAALDELEWLTAYGRAELLVRNAERPNERFYAVPDPDSDTEYIDLWPEDARCNYAWLTAGRVTSADGAQRVAPLSVFVVYDRRKLPPAIGSDEALVYAICERIEHNRRTRVVAFRRAHAPQAVFREARLKTAPEILLRRPYGCCRINFSTSWLPNCP